MFVLVWQIMAGILHCHSKGTHTSKQRLTVGDPLHSGPLKGTASCSPRLLEIPFAGPPPTLSNSQICMRLRMSVGIAHRDLKPENILVNYRHTKTPVVKVCDFGLSLEQKGTWGLLSDYTGIALYAVTLRT